jgi:hypothetical protein
MRYLVDHPQQPYFPHIALAPWPISYREQQSDWIETIGILEEWLKSNVGSHYSAWIYATTQEQESWQACVAFSQAKYKSLFLLRWA